MVAPETEEDGLHKNTLLQLPLGPAYALIGHKAQGLTMFMTYISFLKFWGYGLPYTIATRTPFLDNIHFVGVPPQDIYQSLLKVDSTGMNKIQRKRAEIAEMLQDPSALRDEMQRRIRQGQFKVTNPGDELTILTNLRQYYETWMRRLSVPDGLTKMTQVSTAFKLVRRKLVTQEWGAAVVPFDIQTQSEEPRWPTLQQVLYNFLLCKYVTEQYQK